jgi:hypothetical protein
MRAHLEKLITHAAGQLVKAAARDTVFARNYLKLAELHKATTDGDGAIFAELAELHGQCASDSRELAGHFSACLKELSANVRKAAGFDDLDALEPSPISAVHGDAPPASLRPVFRSGQREFAMLDKNDKASETIAKITSVD